MLLKPQKVGLIWVLIAISIGIFGCGNTDDVMPSAELAARIEAGTAPLILDVRTPEEYAAEHIPGAVNISHTELAGRLAELDAYKNKEIVVHCRSGKRAGLAETVLSDAGFTGIRDLEGHMLQWQENGYPVE
jgi:rhodanese-related sulfurtransferase